MPIRPQNFTEHREKTFCAMLLTDKQIDTEISMLSRCSSENGLDHSSYPKYERWLISLETLKLIRHQVIVRHNGRRHERTIWTVQRYQVCISWENIYDNRIYAADVGGVYTATVCLQRATAMNKSRHHPSIVLFSWLKLSLIILINYDVITYHDNIILTCIMPPAVGWRQFIMISLCLVWLTF